MATPCPIPGEFCYQAERESILLLLLFRPLVRLLHIFPRFFEGSEGVVVGLRSLPVLSYRALALAGDIENLAQLNMAPDFGPAWLAVPINGCSVGIGGGLVVPLKEENLSNAVMREGTVLVEVEGFVEFQERARQVSLLLHRLASQDGGAQLHIAGVRQHMVVGIDRNAARTTEGLD